MPTKCGGKNVPTERVGGECSKKIGGEWQRVPFPQEVVPRLSGPYSFRGLCGVDREELKSDAMIMSYSTVGKLVRVPKFKVGVFLKRNIFPVSSHCRREDYSAFGSILKFSRSGVWHWLVVSRVS